ncbi:MAG: hypothetical protein DWP95_07310 [Proteobacteria bacterium]|nr:MAG: hypothetical protein DWP95_07310 [Pseudomonadota bacterium]
MLRLNAFIMAWFILIGYATAVMAETDAQKAAEDGLQAVTVFIDITRFNRKIGAAKKLTRSHQEFARYGYILVAVNVYTENSDLEGFFVSYQKSQTFKPAE